MHSELLKRVPLFEELSDSELDALSQVALLRTFPKDRVVIMAEEEGDSLFVIHDGQVKVSIVSEDGREVILSILGEGNFFGEMSLLDGHPRSANVTTTQETELLTWSVGPISCALYKNLPRPPSNCFPSWPAVSA